jgi:transcriptional regulator with XRE-family HTH domain
MENIKSRFGIAIRKRRIEIGISQEKLAEISSLHRTYIADVERGKRNISLENIAKLVKALGLSLAEFFSKYF